MFEFIPGFFFFLYGIKGLLAQPIGFPPLPCPLASLVAQLVKNPPAMLETWIQSLGWEDLLEKGKLHTLVSWPGEFHGLPSPRGHKESDTTE